MVAERYEIDDIIGSGGMSVVYRAHDIKLDRYVTLKILKEEYLTDENLIERFPKEARAAAALNHQNIVSIFDHGRDGDILYIVLEYVDGASLKELINRKAPFDDETNLGVAIQIAEGLSEAHLNNIIHLDVKPQNILVTTSSIVKVADFGIARAPKSATMNAGSGSMGSVHYFSPEQARGGYIDHKSDIYSLGIVMFEMATGQLPYEGDTEVAIALQHINNPLPDILEINPNVSDSVVRIILKATEKSASKRYQTVDDMMNDLKRALTDTSGAFVDLEKSDESPTRSISEENREAVRRHKMRQAFLDGVDMPEEDEPVEDGGFELVSSRSTNFSGESREYSSVENYLEGQEYGQSYEFTDEYYEEFNEPPPPTQRDKKADKVATYGGIIFGIILAVGIGILAWYVSSNVLSSTANMVEVPDVLGHSWRQAEIEIRALRLVPIREEDYCGNEFSCDNEECEGECEGQIIAQRVDPEILRSPGDTVRLIVSLGAFAEEEETPDEDDEIDDETPEPDDGFTGVPSLIGLKESDAHDLLRENLLLWNSTRQENDFFPAGEIISHEPGPGERVEIDTVVKLVISTGPAEPIIIQTPEPTTTPEENVNEGETTPEATPGPTPSPTPEVANIDETPQPTPTPDAGAGAGDSLTLVDGVLNIYLPPQVPTDAQSVRLLIQQVTPDGVETDIANAIVPVSEFNPSRPTVVQYSTPTSFRIFFINDETGFLYATAIENR